MLEGAGSGAFILCHPSFGRRMLRLDAACLHPEAGIARFRSNVASLGKDPHRAGPQPRFAIGVAYDPNDCTLEESHKSIAIDRLPSRRKRSRLQPHLHLTATHSSRLSTCNRLAIINRMLARVIRDGIESTDGAGNPV